MVITLYALCRTNAEDVCRLNIDTTVRFSHTINKEVVPCVDSEDTLIRPQSYVLPSLDLLELIQFLCRLRLSGVRPVSRFWSLAV